MQEDLPSWNAFRESALNGQGDADAHDPEEGWEHEVAGGETVPSGVLQPPIATGAVVHENHEHNCDPVTDQNITMDQSRFKIFKINDIGHTG